MRAALLGSAFLCVFVIKHQQGAEHPWTGKAFWCKSVICDKLDNKYLLCYTAQEFDIEAR